MRLPLAALLSAAVLTSSDDDDTTPTGAAVPPPSDVVMCDAGRISFAQVTAMASVKRTACDEAEGGADGADADGLAHWIEHMRFLDFTPPHPRL